MPYPHLPPSLLIGVPSIDSEHETLVELLDRLIKSPHVLPGTETFSEILSQLGGQLMEHFNSEERYIRSCGLPQEEVMAHIEAHDLIVEQYTQLNLKMMADLSHTLSDAAQLIKRWIIEHLLEHDMKIRQYAGG